MKKLIILRHGKSDWTMDDEDDFDRKLTNRGEKNAAEMSLFILNKEGKPDLIYSSDAKRATQTSLIFAKNVDLNASTILFDSHLYLASSYTLMRLIRKMDDSKNFVVLVGHNPGLTELVNNLGVKLDNLPTASAVCFEFDSDRWENIQIQNARIQWIKLARSFS